LAGALSAASAGAQVSVGTSFFDGFSVNPVHIVTGETVYWFAADGYGPYKIISDNNSWPTFETDAGIQFAQLGTFYYHDDVGDSGTVIVIANVPPSVTITNPANNSVLYAPAGFAFSVAASDTDADGLENVEFYAGTNLAGVLSAKPFTLSMTNWPIGNYTLTAIARDNGGARSTNSIFISVVNPPLHLIAATIIGNTFQFTVKGLIVGKTNILQTTTRLSPANWVTVSTNVATEVSASCTNTIIPGSEFFRLVQLP
jgi:hypothetical protein